MDFVAAIARADVAISSSQICVVDPALATPFNDWSDRHVQQGFAWRPGSVSFAVGADCLQLHVAVFRASSKPELAEASTAIRVPFEVPLGGEIEVTSVSEGFFALIAPGHYDLYCVLREQQLDLTFAERVYQDAEVLISSDLARPQPKYLMEADPA